MVFFVPLTGISFYFAFLYPRTSQEERLIFLAGVFMYGGSGYLYFTGNYYVVYESYGFNYRDKNYRSYHIKDGQDKDRYLAAIEKISKDMRKKIFAVLKRENLYTI